MVFNEFCTAYQTPIQIAVTQIDRTMELVGEQSFVGDLSATAKQCSTLISLSVDVE